MDEKVSEEEPPKDENDIEWDDYEYDDDFFEMVPSFDSEEEYYEEREWEEEKKLSIPDWEKEAKKQVRIEMDDPSMGRRKTIHDLESYASSGPSATDIWQLSTQITAEPPTKIRYSMSMEMPGIVRIDLSPLTQKIIGCIIDDNVTTEYPWIYVRKDIIEDNIDLHSESSDFLPVKDEISAYPDSKILVGYAPSLTEKGQFYIVLTEEGRDAMMKHIKTEREDHENRVKNAVYKSIYKWYDLGSGAEIDAGIIKNTRPLFEIEMTSTADLLNAPINLTDRKADDQRDGYIELLPYRQIFENIWRKLVSRSTQVTPGIRYNTAQTAPSIPVNSWFQYVYKYKTVDLSTYAEEEIESLKDFLQRYTDDMCNQILMNSTWDIYTNDFANLVRNEKDTQAPLSIAYKEHQSYYDGKVITNKVINDLCWHPLWTGIAITAYTQYAKSDHLIGPKPYDEIFLAGEDNNRVLIWSFTDSLSPKLILKCPREVTCISACPLDGNIIIGGCTNGQIAIWHIPGKIEQMETVVVQTEAQERYSIAMKNLMIWMRKTELTSLVNPTAMSSLKYSQQAAISKIIWLPPHYKINENGRITSLPEDTALDDLSWQFVTASQDGTIAFWNLKWLPSDKDIRRIRVKQQKTKHVLNNMAQPVSPFKILDRIFKPSYTLVIQYPDENRQPIITTFNMYNPKFHKEKVGTFSLARDDVTIRKHYKLIIEKADYIMEPKMLIGTVEGDFGCITWDGYELASDVSLNRETARWLWIKRMHDGPVTKSVRSNFYHQVVVTVGGKIFAVWRDDFDEPLVWKKSNIGYTACSWGTLRPAVLILGRMDGTVELWDLEVKSHEPCFTQSLSGRIIAGIYAHELPLDPQCVGFCDFTGSLRIFTAPRVLLTYDVSDVEWMKKFIDRQVQRIKEFRAWQEMWCETNPAHVEMKKQLSEMTGLKIRLKDEEKIKTETAEVEAHAAEPTKSIVQRKPWQFLEEAKERWMSMEVKRMQRVILEKKGLRKDVLERQRAPLLRLRQEVKRKKHKIREILNLQDSIFEEAIVFLFPEQRPEERETLLPPLPSPPVPSVERRLTIDELIRKEITIPKEVFDPDEEIIYKYLEVQAEALAKLKSVPFERPFDWRNILEEGKRRRRSMDVELMKLKKPKKMYEV